MRRIHVERIKQLLDNGDLVVMDNLGLSPSGELYNCAAEDVASACAVQLESAKVHFIYFHLNEFAK